MSHASDNRRNSGHMPPDDWDLLFDAVAWRLRKNASGTMAAPALATVEDCLQTLDMLRAELAPERDYLRRIELELRQTRAALAAAQTELTVSHVGERRAWHDSLTALPIGAKSTAG